MSDPAESTPARLAYEAYREVVGAPDVDGEPYGWDDMPKRVQEGFRAAAQAGGTAQVRKDAAEVLGRAEAFLSRGGGWGHTDRIGQAWARFLVQLGNALHPDEEPDRGDPWRDELDEEERQAIRLTVAALISSGVIHYGRACPAPTEVS